ncbi:MAG: cytochrome c [Deltaproteobacteria bacterium]|nr:MAG: cytochrome c [Deltaproteobacteria bacterium]
MKTLVLAVIFAAACGETTLFDPMERQPKFKPFSANAFYDDGRAMRVPPAGTVPRERLTDRPEIAQGKDRDGHDVTVIPIPVTSELMSLGRKKFDIHCAACHGLLGDGVSPVAAKMSLRPPPSLLLLHNDSVGHFFEVISQGYGLMPSYAAELDAQDRWAVVLYLRALRRSQAVALAEVPADIQKQLREEPR